jgi:hypothetical protein
MMFLVVAINTVQIGKRHKVPPFGSLSDLQYWQSGFLDSGILILFLGMWIWMPLAAGFILKVAHRFDIGFEWFNRHFDIETKPLQSIGLVASALVAIVYWAAVIVSRVVG